MIIAVFSEQQFKTEKQELYKPSIDGTPYVATRCFLNPESVEKWRQKYKDGKILGNVDETRLSLIEKIKNPLVNC